MPLPNAVLQQDARGQVPVDGQLYAAGGPYLNAELGKFWVGELWVLAGQSNMKGVGKFQDIETPISQVRSFDMNERWQLAEEPLHHHADSPRPVYTSDMPTITRQQRPDGAGLGLAFAKARHEQTGVPIGLIPCARGNTSMAEWSPEYRDPQESLYGAMLDRIRLCGGKVQGVLWYQGESDAILGDWPGYQTNLDALLCALRADLQQPGLPFLMVQLARYATEPFPELIQGWNAIREFQRQWADTQQHVKIVSAIDLHLTDPIHLSTAGLKRLGRRLTRASFGHAALTPLSLSWVPSTTARRTLRLEIGGVNGELHGPMRPLGFSIRDAERHDLHCLYHTEVEGYSVLLHLSDTPLPDSAQLWYGYGLDPLCNVVDSSDQALLTFGPLTLPPIKV